MEEGTDTEDAIPEQKTSCVNVINVTNVVNNINNVANTSNTTANASNTTNNTTNNNAAVMVVAKLSDFDGDYGMWPKRDDDSTAIDYGKVDFSKINWSRVDIAKLDVSPMMKMTDDTEMVPESIFAYPNIAVPVCEAMQRDIERRDPTLGMFLLHWKEHLENSPDVCPRMAYWKYSVALRGVHRASLRELWTSYHNTDDPKTLDAPSRIGAMSKVYRKPHSNFIVMANDAMQVMKVLMEGCYLNDIHIIRYYWEYHLMKGIDQLELENLDTQKRLRAMLACLILSAATTDFEAINGAINLGKKGLLNSLDALIDAPKSIIHECIRGCGIHNKRAKFLKMAFQEIKKDHNGVVPSDFKGLMDLEGVGRKTASLMLNEGYGFYAGIGTDKHVCHVSLGLGMFVPTHGIKGAPPEHVERSLRTWIRQHDFKDTNRTFGGMAQLVTQKLSVLHTSKGKTQKKDLKSLLGVILNRFGEEKELEIVWFLIAQLRKHYKVVNEKRLTKSLFGDEETDDEGEDDN